MPEIPVSQFKKMIDTGKLSVVKGKIIDNSDKLLPEYIRMLDEEKRMSEIGDNNETESKKRRNDYEHILQTNAINYFTLKYPKVAHLLFAIPNGGKRNLITAKKLKAEGVKSGVLDLFFAYPLKGYCGLFIETKFGKNDLTENQIFYKKEFEAQGYKCCVYWTLEEFIQIMEEYIEN